jgi:prefoldin subunit 5
MQLQRKDENLNFIVQKVTQLESSYSSLKAIRHESSSTKDTTRELKKNYEDRLEEKNRVIGYYQGLM